ncbi:glutamate 5-kinase [Fimbriiglobus ruber]|uniref:Glutamate 5-kinase n=1 Tax=Fimbriiglobus ruber TaxID=1908690 RepID=A0A225DDI9_9BACT|nr:glutamate 5-kinase [Fimbriiglobus ruber]OWK34475.1 Glutamate 5-kinase [Fimbriiglobus ruber]
MVDSTRRDILARAGTVVIKVGTNVLADAAGHLDRARIQSLADQVQRVRAAGRGVALVSSGAIGAGVGKLGLGKRPADLPHLQACAAVGQSALMQLYQECLNPHGVHTAQLLLTAGDFDSRARYLNVRNTILTLLEYNCLPVINENDTVSVAEIKFGDNDHLAAMVANLLQAPLLVLLTNVDGLYNADPREDPTARLVTTVPHIDRAVTDMAGATKSTLGTGGMRSKLSAARLATNAGGAVIMANGSTDGVLDSVFAGEPVGTLFLPHGEAMPAWKRWLGYTARPKGTLTIDAGAEKALSQGRSLLPVGVRGVKGDFGKGDVVAVCTSEGTEVARGLTNYPSDAATKIAGLKTEQIEEVLGNFPYVELIHRDNLVVIG